MTPSPEQELTAYELGNGYYTRSKPSLHSGYMDWGQKGQDSAGGKSHTQHRQSPLVIEGIGGTGCAYQHDERREGVTDA